MNFIDSMQWTKIIMDELHLSLLVDMVIKMLSNCLFSETFLVILNHCAVHNNPEVIYLSSWSNMNVEKQSN